MSRIRDRRVWLRQQYFTPLEAKMLSIIPKKTPALRAVVQDRLARRERFDRIAFRKVERGQWDKQDIPAKWLKNLSRMYQVRGWRVKQGAVGKQPRMLKGMPNPWAMYRDYIRQTPDKGFVSPWELRQIRTGKTALDKGLIFIQRQTQKGGTVSGVPKPMIQKWIDEKNLAIVKARGQHRRDLIEQRERLRKSL